jgi:glycosyltransferase involved in cell wall biosynthesis
MIFAGVAMDVLYIHNDYALPSGEERAAEQIVGLLSAHGHAVEWFRRTSAGLLDSSRGKAKAFFCGIHNPAAAAALEATLRRHTPGIALVQNIYPLISPSIFPVLKRWRIPVVMRCPNYRLFCPNGRHLVRGKLCDRCLRPGRELWCALRNCEDNVFKSTAYALRNATARIRGSILKTVHVFLVQSQFQRDRFIRNGMAPGQVDILPGALRVPDLPEPVPLGDAVTYVGRISAEKGIEDFMEAARLLPGIPFIAAGDSRPMPGVRERSPANLTWLGFLEGNDLRELYLRSRIIVVPSRWYEGFPNVLLQAMAFGKPVICSAIGGLPEIVDDGVVGRLCRPGDPRDLADQVRGLYDDPSLCRRLGRAGREKVRREYSLDACYQRLVTVFRKAESLLGSMDGPRRDECQVCPVGIERCEDVGEKVRV